MKLTSIALFVAVCVACWGAPAHAVSTDSLPECTDEQLTTAQKIIAAHEIETTCTTLKIDAAGVPDLTNVAFCSDEKCTKTIKKVRKSMPSCKYNGSRLRAGMNKLVKACDAAGITTSGDGDSGSDSPATTTAPKTKKPKKTATPTPSEAKPISSSDGSLVGATGKEGTLIEMESTITPETTVPSTTAPATAARVNAESSSASAVAIGTASVTLLSTALLAYLS